MKSNAEEQKFLASELGQDYLASAIYRAFKNYKLDIEEKLKSSLKMAEDMKQESQLSVKKGIEGLKFKVQLTTSATKIKTDPDNFKGMENVEIYEAGGLFRYTYGSTSTWDEAVVIRKEVRTIGYTDAFIVAFLNGNRISVGEANKLLSEAL